MQFHAARLFGFQLTSSYLAVDLFFALSGIVLARTYECRFASGLTPAQFMKARLVRLYPLYIVGTVLGATFIALKLFTGDFDGSISSLLIAILASAFFLPTPLGIGSDHDLFPFVYPAWSLLFELTVNFAYVLIFPLLTTRRLALLIGSGAVLVIWSAVYFKGLDSGSNWTNFEGGIGRVTFSFFVGVLIARHPFKWRGGGLHAILSAIVLLIMLATPVSEAYRPAFDLIVVLIAFPALLSVASVSEGGETTRKTFLFLGSLSYAIYVVHAPLLWWSMGLSSRLLGLSATAHAPISGVIFAAGLCLLAYVLEKHFDRPVRRWLSRRVSSGRAMAVQPVREAVLVPRQPVLPRADERA